MTFKSNVIEALLLQKEAELGKLSDENNKSNDLIELTNNLIDGLVNNLNVDEELAIKAVEDSLKKSKEGCLIKNIKDTELDEMASTDREIANREKNQHRSTKFAKNALFIKNNIHPSAVWSKHNWRAYDKEGNLIYFRILDISEKSPKSEGLVSIAYVSHIVRKSGMMGEVLTKDDVKQPASKIVNLLNDKNNYENYMTLISKTGDDTRDKEGWQDQFNQGQERQQAAFKKWYDDNYFELSSIEEKDAYKIWQDTIAPNGTTMRPLRVSLQRYKDNADKVTKEATDTLNEAPKEERIKSKVALRNILRQLGINPSFLTHPMIKHYPEALDPSDTEPPLYFTIQSLPAVPIDEMEFAWISKMGDEKNENVKMMLDEIREIQSEPANLKVQRLDGDADAHGNIELDIEDWDNFYRGKDKHITNAGSVYEGRDLTDTNIRNALEYVMSQDLPMFKGDDLLAYYDENPNNPLILKALNQVDRSIKVSKPKDKTSSWGYKYQLQVPLIGEDGKIKIRNVQSNFNTSDSYKSMVNYE